MPRRKPRYLAFWCEAAKRAAKGSVEKANAWAWAVGTLLLWAALSELQLTKVTAPVTIGGTIALTIALAFAAVLLAWGVIFFVRLLGAPAAIYGDAQETIDALSATIADLNKRRVPQIRVFLEGPENGIQPFPANDGSVFKYVQFTVTPASDFALMGCEARLEKVTRLNSDGTTTELAEEHIYCGWSNLPVVALDLHPRVQHRVNLFHSHSHRKHVLSVDTLPQKILLLSEIQKFGSYLVSVNVTARDAPTCNAVFKFHWGGFNDMSFTQEA